MNSRREVVKTVISCRWGDFSLILVYLYMSGFELFLLVQLILVLWKKSSLKSCLRIVCLWFGCPLAMDVWSRERIPVWRKCLMLWTRESKVLFSVILLSGDYTGDPLLKMLAYFSECEGFDFRVLALNSWSCRVPSGELLQHLARWNLCSSTKLEFPLGLQFSIPLAN